MNGYKMHRVGIQYRTNKTKEEPAENDVHEGLPGYTPTVRKGETAPLRETSYICNECGRNFIGYSLFIQHREMHQGKYYKCTDCMKSYKYEEDLIRHQKTHTVERPYKCTECQLCFGKNSDLVLHQRGHRGEKPYQCTKCEECFAQSVELVLHQVNHNEEEPEKNTNFDKSSQNPPPLKTLRKTFGEKKRFQCAQCVRSFTTIWYLRNHERARHVPKIIQCPKCSQDFCFHSDFIVHARSRACEEPYICPDCGSSFRLQSNLTSHRKSHKGPLGVRSQGKEPTLKDEKTSTSTRKSELSTLTRWDAW